MPRNERTEDLGLEARRFTQSRTFTLIMAVLFGTGGGTGINYIFGNPELTQKIALLEYKVEQNEVLRKELAKAREESLNQRLEAIETKLSNIENILIKR